MKVMPQNTAMVDCCVVCLCLCVCVSSMPRKSIRRNDTRPCPGNFVRLLGLGPFSQSKLVVDGMPESSLCASGVRLEQHAMHLGIRSRQNLASGC